MAKRRKYKIMFRKLQKKKESIKKILVCIDLLWINLHFNLI